MNKANVNTPARTFSGHTLSHGCLELLTYNAATRLVKKARKLPLAQQLPKVDVPSERATGVFGWLQVLISVVAISASGVAT